MHSVFLKAPDLFKSALPCAAFKGVTRERFLPAADAARELLVAPYEHTRARTQLPEEE